MLKTRNKDNHLHNCKQLQHIHNRSYNSSICNNLMWVEDRTFFTNPVQIPLKGGGHGKKLSSLC